MVKPIMNIKEVANYLNFSVKKLYRLVETRRIPASKVGRQYRFFRETITNWLKDQDIFLKPDWSARLDSILQKMRAQASKKKLRPQDIEREIKRARRS